MGSQCYLPPDTSERTRPSPQPVGRYSIYLPRRDGRLSWSRLPGNAPARNRTRDLSITSPTPYHYTNRATRISWPPAMKIVARVYGQNGDKPKWRQTRTATSLSWNKQNYGEYLLKKDIRNDKLLVVLIVVTLLRLIVRFFHLRLCKMNDTILCFQYVGFRCISYFSRFFPHTTRHVQTCKILARLPYRNTACINKCAAYSVNTGVVPIR